MSRVPKAKNQTLEHRDGWEGKLKKHGGWDVEEYDPYGEEE